MKLNEIISTLARTAVKSAPAVGNVIARSAWDANPKIASELVKLSPQLRREFLVRFPSPQAMEKTLDDIYQQAVVLHNSGNKTAAQSLLTAHDHLNMMFTAGPSDQLMTAFKAALKSQTP
jgi:hypothetical protein